MIAASVALEPYEKKAHLRIELAEKEIWAKHEKKHAKHIIAQKQAKQKMSAATRNWKAARTRLAKKHGWTPGWNRRYALG